MTTVTFETSAIKKHLTALTHFLESFNVKPIEIGEKTLHDMTRQDYLDSIPYNRKPVAISKSFRKNYGKI